MVPPVPDCCNLSSIHHADSSSAVGRQVRHQYRLTSHSDLVAVNLTSGRVVKYTGPASAAPLLQWADSVRAGLLSGQGKFWLMTPTLITVCEI